MSGALLHGKKGLIMGVANNRSLAWGIAQDCSQHGAELAFSYQGEALEKRLSPLAESIGSSMLVPCDVLDSTSIDATFEFIRRRWGKLDFLVHAIAFSDKNELKGRYIDTSEENFLRTMNISCYSFVAVARRAAELMTDGGSILTLSYYGAEKVIPNYNVMGVAKAALEASVRYIAVDLGGQNIRVNAISSGPVKTLAASGISGISDSLKWTQENSPLKRNTTLADVGGAGVYLISDLASGVTGEVMHVDSGYSITGMKMHFTDQQ